MRRALLSAAGCWLALSVAAGGQNKDARTETPPLTLATPPTGPVKWNDRLVIDLETRWSPLRCPPVVAPKCTGERRDQSSRTLQRTVTVQDALTTVVYDEYTSSPIEEEATLRPEVGRPFVVDMQSKTVQSGGAGTPTAAARQFILADVDGLQSWSRLASSLASGAAELAEADLIGATGAGIGVPGHMCAAARSLRSSRVDLKCPTDSVLCEGLSNGQPCLATLEVMPSELVLTAISTREQTEALDVDVALKLVITRTVTARRALVSEGQ